MIQRYEDKYKEDVKDLIRAFYEEELYKDTPGSVTDEILYDTIEKYKEYSFVAVEDGKAIGVLGGFVIPTLVTNGLMWQEVIWYVDPNKRKYGVRLYKESEKILKAMGIQSIITACLVNDKTNNIMDFYRRLGYKPLEIHLIKGLQ